MSSMYCSLANDAFVEMFTRHYDDEFTCNLEECMLFDVIRKVSTGLTEIGVVTISLTARRWRCESWRMRGWSST